MISSKHGHWRRDIGSPSLPGDKTFKHGVETYWFPAIEKNFKMGNLLVNCVLGPQDCTGSGLMNKGTRINAGSYCANLQRLRAAVKQKGSKLFTKDALLLQDNARSHISTTT
jgi:hypothetical protein